MGLLALGLLELEVDPLLEEPVAEVLDDPEFVDGELDPDDEAPHADTVSKSAAAIKAAPPWRKNFT